MALVLYRPAFWVLSALSIVFLFWLARRLRLRWWPAWLTRVLLMVVLLFALFSPRGELLTRERLPQREVLVVDESASIPSEVRLQTRERARAWHSQQSNRLVVVYGEHPELVLSPQDAWPDVQGDASHPEEALRLARKLLGNGPGKIFLASDGGATAIPRIDEVMEELGQRSQVVDVIPLPTRGQGRDLFVGSLWVPRNLWEHTPFAAVLPVYAPLAGEATVRLEVNGEVVAERQEQLSAGENFVAFPLETKTKDVLTLGATALLEGDPHPENNQAFATVQVFPAPHVLIITEKPEVALGFAEILVAGGVFVDTVSAWDFPTDLAALQSYQVIVIHDLLAEELRPEQMLALDIFVAEKGGGLLFLGGRNSYTLGGYKHTLLESLLPVRLEPPPRQERAPVTFILVLDRSHSMRFALGHREIKPIALAREAAVRAMEVLQSQDYLGVLSYASGVLDVDQTHWDVPIGPVGDGLALRQAQDAISRIEARGGTKTYAALEVALQTLQATETTEVRHVLLLSDGKSADGSLGEFQVLAAEAREAGITISTIALGPAVDPKEMSAIALHGGGRYHTAETADALPQIMVSEGRATQSENVQMGKTSLLPGEGAHPILGGMSVAQIPTLRGYNALTSKADEGAEDILLSANFRDPLLSAWAYGLGRVVAWMGDIGEDWAADWPTWQKADLFWSQVVRYALPDPDRDAVQVDVRTEGSRFIVSARIEDAEGLPINLARPTLSYMEGETRRTLALSQDEPGVYVADIERPPVGAYRGVLRYGTDHGGVESVVPFAVSYPAEWQPADAREGHERLRGWAAATGGTETTFEALSLASEPTSEPSPIDLESLGSRLLLALIIAWPVEIALRRRWLPWR